MARVHIQLGFAILFALDFMLQFIDGGANRALILPLSLSSSSNLSPHRALDPRYQRHLLREDNSNFSNARMPLYDDLLLHGYYTTRLYIGTPPQKFALIVDTGSTVTYVPCSDCKSCGRHQDPKFEPDLSSTYHPVNCNIDCDCDDERKQCIYERRYAEMSSSSGVLGEDIISFGDKSELKPQRAVFGCENLETGDLYSQHADGIMGLGRGQLSIVDQLVDKGAIRDSFSLCYGGMDIGGGAMVLGSYPPPSDMIFTRSDPVRSSYYNIELKEIQVAGEPLKLSPKIFDGRHGTILDSGTTYTYLPEAAFTAFRKAIMKNIHPLIQIRGPDPKYHDICFNGAGRNISQLSKTFPKVEMVFSNSQKLLLTPENYLFRHTKVSGAYCLGIFQNKDTSTLLGGIVVRNTLVMYDRANERVGFWKTNCSELLKTLQIPLAPAPAPAPTAAYVNNTSIRLPPAMAPTAAVENILPGEIHVGLITFEMSLSGYSSSVRPNVTELALFIVNELEVNASQVHLLDSTSEENHSLVRWAIYPAASSNYFSKTTAKNIIMRLTEHRMELPERFGSYHLVGWQVEPQNHQGWWHRHLAVFIGGFLTLIVLSSIAIWIFVRRRYQTPTTYERVGTVAPEQELQPLSLPSL